MKFVSSLPLVIWAAASYLLMIIGAVGTWATGPFGVSVSGLDDGRDGWFVLGAAAFSVFMLYPYCTRMGASRVYALFALLAGLLGSAVAIYDWRALPENVSSGWGLNLSLVASISSTLVSAVLGVERRPDLPTV